MPTIPPRLLCVGASNLARMALPLLAAARARAGGPVEAHLALGRGRSFGVRSSLLGRGLDGIRHSALWPLLPTLPTAPTTAVLLDVGNDLLYGFSPPAILGWVDEVLQRLAAAASERHVVGLPLAAIDRLRPWQFRLVRSVLFPPSRLTFADARSMSQQLHDGLRTLAARHGATFHELPLASYGFDPVHVRRSCWQRAVRSWLEVPDDAAEPTPPVAGTFAQLRFLFAAPNARTWFGRPQHGRQPARRWADGSSLSLW
jgi:hypothetical protein